MCHSGLHNKHKIITTIGTIDQLQNVLKCDICNHHFEDGIPLCSIHYNESFRGINLAAPCASCGALPGGGKRFLCHPPNSMLVNRVHSQKGSDSTDLLAMMSVQCMLCVCYFTLSAMSHYTFF